MGSLSAFVVLVITRRSLGSMISISGLKEKKLQGDVCSDQTNYNFLRSSLSNIEDDSDSDWSVGEENDST